MQFAHGRGLQYAEFEVLVERSLVARRPVAPSGRDRPHQSVMSKSQNNLVL
jgi:hypothetical protein